MHKFAWQNKLSDECNDKLFLSLSPYEIIKTANDDCKNGFCVNLVFGEHKIHIIIITTFSWKTSANKSHLDTQWNLYVTDVVLHSLSCNN